MIDVCIVEKNKIQTEYGTSKSALRVDSGIIESYILDEVTFDYIGSNEEEADIFILEWGKLFQAMHDLKAIHVETIKEDFTIDELYTLLEMDEIHNLKYLLYRVVQHPKFSRQDYVIMAKIEKVKENLFDI